jgi:uncharacterized protein (TIGR03067 family)
MPGNIRMRLAAAVVVAIAAAVGWFVWSWGGQPAQGDPPATLDGQWRCVGMERDGEASPRWLVEAGAITLAVEGDAFSIPNLLMPGATFSLPASPANAIDIRVKLPDGKPAVIQCLYALDGNRLKLCLPMSRPDEARPTELTTRGGDGCTLFEFERAAPGQRPATDAEQLGVVMKEGQANNLTPADRERLAACCLKIADSCPGTDEAVVSALWALANAPDGPSRKRALALLKSGLLVEADVPTLAMCFGVQRSTIGPGDVPEDAAHELSPLLLERARRSPDHPKTAELLSAVCSTGKDREAAEAPAAFDEAAQVIGERWTRSPDISHFLESLSSCRQRPWACRYEAVVRKIVAQNPNAYIRHRAAFTLAQIVAESGEERQEEGRELYVKFVKEARPGEVEQSVTSQVEGMVKRARWEIDGLLIRGVGGPAPPLKGLDLDGKPIDLAEYRGKAVLLSFWASWCGPCMRLVPHERTLVQRFAGRPFALVGVNGDKIDKLDRKLLETHKITWRSFQNARAGQKSISSEWALTAWPELYLIDHTGKIRRHWIGTPPLDELDHEVARWVAVAEGKPLPPFRPGGKAEAPKKGKGLPAKFIEKRLGDVKYVVCVPEGHDGKAPLPVVLFLHGSGQVGTDNKEQLEIGLGPAIRKDGMAFPFVGVFPQARSSWRADSADGKRAMAILEAVEREYATDRKRVYLTGVSMGGAGTWGLATAHPKRFAAIVPVCGGGDPKRAAVLKDVPCWAFHGDADEIVPVQATRDMVRAVTRAGGRPQYQEYRGVGHNCWGRVYADAEMYRWLRGQARR